MEEALGSRRFTAFVIDCLAFLALSILFLYPLTQINQNLFRIGSPLPDMFQSATTRSSNGVTTAQISGTWSSSSCVEPEVEPPALLALIAPQEPRLVLVCADTFLGLPNGHTTYVQYFRAGRTQTGQQGDTTVTVTERGPAVELAVTTDSAGDPVRALFPVGLMTFGLMLAVTAFGWRSPGKLVAGLRLESVGGTCHGCRELRRLGPFLLGGVFALATGLFSAEIDLSTTLQRAVLVLQLAFWIFAVWYYALPAFSEPGRARYDWATKFRVILA